MKSISKNASLKNYRMKNQFRRNFFTKHQRVIFLLSLVKFFGIVPWKNPGSLCAYRYLCSPRMYDMHVCIHAEREREREANDDITKLSVYVNVIGARRAERST